MTKHRFRLLEMAMIRRGVALRHARRAALELESHHHDLAGQALARGETPEQAQRSADDALGSDAMLVERYAQQRELRSRAHRWRAGYVLAPLFGFAAVFAVEILALIAISSRLTVLHHVKLPAALTHDVGLAVSAFLLWLVPAAVAMAFGVLAGRQHIGLRWLLAGMVVLSICAAQMNVRFELTGGSPPGVIGAGIGFSVGNLPLELLHLLAVMALTLVPAALLRHRETSRRLALE